MRAAPELLGAPTIGGGSARPWGGGGEFPRSHTFTAVRNSQKRRKMGGCEHILAYKSPKTPFFALKYLTRYTHETFFEEYINIKNFRNLSHCGVIPVWSFVSHIRPQPHGLGLTLNRWYLIFNNFKGNLLFKSQKTSFSSLSQNMWLISIHGASAVKNT